MDTASELELEEGIEENISTLMSLGDISEYELERGKPVPTRKHGTVQANLLIALSRYYTKSSFALFQN